MRGEKATLKRLFSPVRINSMELKNRIIMPAMTTLLGNADGTVSDGFIDYYTARARGGAALITAETADVHPYTHNLALGERGFTAIYDATYAQITVLLIVWLLVLVRPRGLFTGRVRG